MLHVLPRTDIKVTCKVKDEYKCYTYGHGQISRSHVRPRTDIEVTCKVKDGYQCYMYGQGQM